MFIDLQSDSKGLSILLTLLYKFLISSSYSLLLFFQSWTTDNHVSVSEVATTYLGGGGHRNAGGCNVNAITNTLTSKSYSQPLYEKLINNLYVTKTRINNKEYNIAIINLPFHKYEVSKYLCQTKFTTKKDNGVEITNVTNILSLRKTILARREKEDETVPVTDDNVDWDNKEFVSSFRSELKNNIIDVVYVWDYDGRKTKHVVKTIGMSKGEIKEFADSFEEEHTVSEIDQDGIFEVTFDDKICYSSPGFTNPLFI